MLITKNKNEKFEFYSNSGREGPGLMTNILCTTY